MRLLISALLTCGFALAAHGQQPSPPPKKETKTAPKLSSLPLEELLAQALKDNADIRVAEVKVREAEAELNRTRLAVLQKLTKAHHDLEVRRNAVQEAKARHDRAALLQRSKAIGTEEFELVRITLSKAEAEVAELEAQLPYLIGKAQVSFVVDFVWTDDLRRFWEVNSAKVKADQPHGTLAEKLRKVLDTPMTGEWRDTPVQEIAAFFGAKFQAEQINFFDRLNFPGPIKITMEIKQPLPVAAALQFLEDQLHKRGRFVIREYGIVLADPNSLPPGALFVIDFWKNKLDPIRLSK